MDDCWAIICEYNGLHGSLNMCIARPDLAKVLLRASRLWDWLKLGLTIIEEQKELMACPILDNYDTTTMLQQIYGSRKISEIHISWYASKSELRPAGSTANCPGVARYARRSAELRRLLVAEADRRRAAVAVTSDPGSKDATFSWFETAVAAAIAANDTELVRDLLSNWPEKTKTVSGCYHKYWSYLNNAIARARYHPTVIGTVLELVPGYAAILMSRIDGLTGITQLKSFQLLLDQLGGNTLWDAIHLANNSKYYHRRLGDNCCLGSICSLSEQCVRLLLARTRKTTQDFAQMITNGRGATFKTLLVGCNYGAATAEAIAAIMKVAARITYKISVAPIGDIESAIINAWNRFDPKYHITTSMLFSDHNITLDSLGLLACSVRSKKDRRLIKWFAQLVGDKFFTVASKIFLLRGGPDDLRFARSAQITQCDVFCGDRPYFGRVLAAADAHRLRWLISKFSNLGEILFARLPCVICGREFPHSATNALSVISPETRAKTFLEIFISLAAAETKWLHRALRQLFYREDFVLPHLWAVLLPRVPGLVVGQSADMGASMRLELLINALQSACCSKYFPDLDELAELIPPSALQVEINSKAYVGFTYSAMVWLVRRLGYHALGKPRKLRKTYCWHRDGGSCANDSIVKWNHLEYMLHSRAKINVSSLPHDSNT